MSVPATHLYRSLQLYWKRNPEMQVFPCEYCEIFKNIFCEKHLPTPASAAFFTERLWINMCMFSLTFMDAESACQKFGKNGHLASIFSFEENEAVFSYLINASLDFAWIGLTNQPIIKGKRFLLNCSHVFVYW